MTPEEFWEMALTTGRTIQIQHKGKEHELGVILDPQALIEAIRNRSQNSPQIAGLFSTQ